MGCVSSSNSYNVVMSASFGLDVVLVGKGVF